MPATRILFYAAIKHTPYIDTFTNPPNRCRCTFYINCFDCFSQYRNINSLTFNWTIMKYATLFALAIALSTGANAAVPTGGARDYGQPVASAQAARSIDVTPATKYVNVTNGETVSFNINGQTFSWYVSTYPGVHQFRLKDIAPGALGIGDIRVFVSANPLYVGP